MHVGFEDGAECENHVVLKHENVVLPGFMELFSFSPSPFEPPWCMNLGCHACQVIPCRTNPFSRLQRTAPSRLNLVSASSAHEVL